MELGGSLGIFYTIVGLYYSSLRFNENERIRRISSLRRDIRTPTVGEFFKSSLSVWFLTLPVEPAISSRDTWWPSTTLVHLDSSTVPAAIPLVYSYYITISYPSVQLHSPMT
jgi:hypothetical protein